VDRSRSNVLLLALCQAAFISTSALMATIGTLAGHALAADKALATLPATALTIGTALGTIPGLRVAAIQRLIFHCVPISATAVDMTASALVCR